MGLLEVVDREMLNRKEMPQQAFSEKLKKKWKNVMPVGSLLVHHAEGHLLMFCS
jgi:hypothetical protein